MPTTDQPKRTWRKRFARGVLFLSLLGIGAGLILLGVACETMGKRASGSRLEKVKKSARYDDKVDSFQNFLSQSEMDSSVMFRGFLDRSSLSSPVEKTLPTQVRKKADFAHFPSSGLRVTWFGHSSFLVELDGKRILVDPVWGERASPFSFVGPARFVAPVIPLADLPKLDAVIISHDHYDHLDHPTIVELAKTGVQFVVPLGVGAHLAYWGVPEAQIIDLDWWQETSLGDVRLVATPARHFSGRGLTDRNATLWASWSMIGPAHRVFYSGDTALHEEFAVIGEKLGPFDFTLMESGAYNPSWADVHLGPEQSVRAHRLVQGKTMIAAHWGLFDLSFHSWVAPIERVLAAAKKENVHVVTPQIGGQIDIDDARIAPQKWWPVPPAENAVPWKTGEEETVHSSKVKHLMSVDMAATLSRQEQARDSAKRAIDIVNSEPTIAK